jgi:dehydrogenase/reductase SDR family protein 7
MDASPALWIFERFGFCSQQHLEQQFQGKRIWISGASSGIGAELAQQLASCKASLVLSGRNLERLGQVASKCGAGTTVVAMEVDCNQIEMDRIVQQVGPVDCVILNAGIGQQSPAVKTSRETTEQIFRVNALAPIHWTQTILKQPNPPSHFVVTSSVASKFAVPLSASYSASKHAVHAYFASLATEQPHLKISLPCPGPVASNFFNTTSDPEAQHKERKMETKRCARLILATMLMSGNRETYIAQQPTLLFCYLHQYLPGVANWMLRTILGPTRVALWEAGLNLYDPASLKELRRLKREKQQTQGKYE